MPNHLNSTSLKVSSTLPILYSFRRCPYAIRARLAIAQSTLSIELREIILRNKPEQLLTLSPKGTVPVLLLKNGKVIDESLSIMNWALTHSDKENWLKNGSQQDILHLIHWNDNEFKYFLDRYKYSDRYPENSKQYFRDKAGIFLLQLEKRLEKHSFLCGRNCSLADIAIFPFIRQFANVDYDWFQKSKYRNTNLWLIRQTESPLFISVMNKYPEWQANKEKLIVNFLPSNN